MAKVDRKKVVGLLRVELQDYRVGSCSDTGTVSIRGYGERSSFFGIPTVRRTYPVAKLYVPTEVGRSFHLYWSMPPVDVKRRVFEVVRGLAARLKSDLSETG